MMMRNGGNQRFCNVFRQGNTQRNVHGYGQRIFDHQKINLELFDEFLQPNLQEGFEGVNRVRDRRFAPFLPKDVFVDPSGLCVLEMGFRNQEAF